MHFYAFNIGDYTSHTAHLSPLEDIAYRRLLDLYYQTETPIQDDIKAICRQIRMREHADEVQVVLSEFFKLIDGSWVSVRCDRELEIYRLKGDASRSNGKKGGRPRKQRETHAEPENNLLGFSGLENQNLNETQTEPEEKLNKKHETVNSNHETGKDNSAAKPRSSSKAAVVSCPVGVSEQTWSDFVRLRKEKKAAITETAMAGIEREAVKANYTLEQALQTCCARGWRGFEADWVLGRRQARQLPRHQEPDFTQKDYGQVRKL